MDEVNSRSDTGEERTEWSERLEDIIQHTIQRWKYERQGYVDTGVENVAYV